jgi:predicted nucleic acid-binding protein
MPVEVVVDASLAVKWFISEAGSKEARALAASGAVLTAPEFVLIELASVAAKRLKRGDIGRDQAGEMVAAASQMFTHLIPLAGLTTRAFELAADNGFSAYDGLYLALAEQRRVRLTTADARLVARANMVGLGHLIQASD